MSELCQKNGSGWGSLEESFFFYVRKTEFRSPVNHGEIQKKTKKLFKKLEGYIRVAESKYVSLRFSKVGWTTALRKDSEPNHGC